MTNILVDALPQSVNIDGTDVAITTDWKICLKTIMAFEDSTLTAQEKHLVLINNMFDEIPENLAAASEKAVWFLNAGRDDQNEKSPRLLSFEKDANLIFAAFRQTHSIDLSEHQMHWWVFMALFMDLGTETTFCQMVSLRKRIKDGKASKEEKQAAKEMGAMFDVDDDENLTLAELDAIDKFEKLLAEGRQKRNEKKDAETTPQKI